MIGWRIGWVVGPTSVMADVARVHIYNVVTPTGIAQAGAAAALLVPDSDFEAARVEWERRRDTVTAQLQDFVTIPAAGGWSQLLDVSAVNLDSFTASTSLLARGKVAATPMRDWGDVNGDRFVRLVFSNEPVARLEELGARVVAAFEH